MEIPRSDPPRVTVLLPVHDAERWLAEAVESILAQSFRDFELLAIDDGSRDGSAAILDAFGERDPRVRVVRRPHEGLIATLNAGLALARGELVARMDADDVALPQRLEHQLARLAADPSLVCIGSAYEVIDAKGRRIDAVHPVREPEQIASALLEGASVLCHATALYRRREVLEAGGYDPAARLAEDYDLWLRLAERGRLANLAEPTLRVRYHAASQSERFQAEQLEQTRRICDRARKRRGLAPLAVPLPNWRPLPDRTSRQQFLIGVSRAAWRLGERRTAIVYALEGAAAHPFSPWLLRFLGHEIRRRVFRRGAAA
jgi:glycosyltransferase involved in cell wall biosynthesis